MSDDNRRKPALTPKGRVDAIIDLRSDTGSLPTRRMRIATANAQLGDETFGEDPTVLELESLLCSVFGFEAAMLCVSATMCNIVALMTHCPSGGEVLLDRNVHVLRAEAGAIARIAGVVPTVVQSSRGHPTVAGVIEGIHPVTVVTPTPMLLWLENTHNRAGGTVMAAAEQRAVADAAHGAGLKVHLDGARIFNAAVAQGIHPRDASVGADSLTVDLTKSLSCPLGAVILGNDEFIKRARIARRVLGGGMRQAGVIAAPALAALREDYARRIEREHALARLLATCISPIDGFDIDPDSVETNMVFVGCQLLGTSADVARACRAAGLLVSELPPYRLRLVVYRGVTRKEVVNAGARLRRVSEQLHRGS